MVSGSVLEGHSTLGTCEHIDLLLLVVLCCFKEGTHCAEKSVMWALVKTASTCDAVPGHLWVPLKSAFTLVWKQTLYYVIGNLARPGAGYFGESFSFSCKHCDGRDSSTLYPRVISLWRVDPFCGKFFPYLLGFSTRFQWVPEPEDNTKSYKYHFCLYVKT